MAVTPDRTLHLLQITRTDTIVKYAYLFITIISLLSSRTIAESTKGEHNSQIFDAPLKICSASNLRSLQWRLMNEQILLFFYSDFKYVTCGSVLKLLNPKHNVRLHSHEVKYGSGSGQQVRKFCI